MTFTRIQTVKIVERAHMIGDAAATDDEQVAPFRAIIQELRQPRGQVGQVEQASAELDDVDGSHPVSSAWRVKAK